MSGIETHLLHNEINDFSLQLFNREELYVLSFRLISEMRTIYIIIEMYPCNKTKHTQTDGYIWTADVIDSCLRKQRTKWITVINYNR